MTGLMRARSRARSRARQDREAGVTLVELLVTMMLLGMLGAIVTGSFVASTDSLQRSTWRQENTGLAQLGMENLTKAVRAGSLIEQASGATALPALVQAAPTLIEVHAFLGPRPVRLRYEVDATGQLLETRWAADATSSSPYWTFTGAPTQRTVIGRVVNSATVPLFVYHDGTGSAFPAGALSEAQRRGVRSVSVTLHVQAETAGRVRPAEMQQRVHLPNLGSIG